jgi:hypothetical protein
MYSLAREGTSALMVTGFSAKNVHQKCPFRLLRVEVLKTRIAHPKNRVVTEMLTNPIFAPKKL